MQPRHRHLEREEKDAISSSRKEGSQTRELEGLERLTVREKLQQMKPRSFLPPFEKVDLESGEVPTSVGEEEVLEGDGRVEGEWT